LGLNKIFQFNLLFGGNESISHVSLEPLFLSTKTILEFELETVGFNKVPANQGD